MMRSGLSISIVISGVMFAACNGPSTGLGDDAAQYRKWLKHAPSSYSYIVTRSCECLPDWIGPVEIVVRNGVVQSRTYTRTQQPVDPAKYWDRFATVDSIFARLREARVSDPASLRVEYDKQWGFPTTISVDVYADYVDDEYAYSARDFRVLSTSSQD